MGSNGVASYGRMNDGQRPGPGHCRRMLVIDSEGDHGKQAAAAQYTVSYGVCTSQYRQLGKGIAETQAGGFYQGFLTRPEVMKSMAGIELLSHVGLLCTAEYTIGQQAVVNCVVYGLNVDSRGRFGQSQQHPGTGMSQIYMPAKLVYPFGLAALTYEKFYLFW